MLLGGGPDPRYPEDARRAGGDERGPEGNVQEESRHLLAALPSVPGERFEAAQLVPAQRLRFDHPADHQLLLHGPLAEAIDDLPHGTRSQAARRLCRPIPITARPSVSWRRYPFCSSRRSKGANGRLLAIAMAGDHIVDGLEPTQGPESHTTRMTWF